MKITITPTQQVANVNNAPARVWEGVSESGVKCLVFVAMVAVCMDDDTREYEAALAPLDPSTAVLPLVSVLEEANRQRQREEAGRARSN